MIIRRCAEFKSDGAAYTISRFERMKTMSLYESIMQGLNEAIEYEQGKDVKARKVVREISPVPKYSAIQIKEIRNALKLTQKAFAILVGVSPKTVEAWEAGTNQPIGVACRLLSILEMDNNIPEKLNIITTK